MVSKQEIESIKYNLNRTYVEVRSVGSKVRNGRLNHKDAIDDMSRLLTDVITTMNKLVDAVYEMEDENE